MTTTSAATDNEQRLPKWARERLEAYRRSIRLAQALRFTEDVTPDIAPPKSYNGDLSTGYGYNAFNDTIAPCCSSVSSHGWNSHDKTTTQRPIFMYSTRVRALRALRREVEIQCAKRLADIDAKIEKELGQ